MVPHISFSFSYPKSFFFFFFAEKCNFTFFGNHLENFRQWYKESWIVYDLIMSVRLPNKARHQYLVTCRLCPEASAIPCFSIWQEDMSKAIGNFTVDLPINQPKIMTPEAHLWKCVNIFMYKVKNIIKNTFLNILFWTFGGILPQNASLTHLWCDVTSKTTHMIFTHNLVWISSLDFMFLFMTKIKVLLEYFLYCGDYLFLKKKEKRKKECQLFTNQRLRNLTVPSYREQRKLKCWGKRENRPSLRICPFLCGSESVNVMAVAGLSGVKSVVSLRSLWTWMSHMRIEGRTLAGNDTANTWKSRGAERHRGSRTCARSLTVPSWCFLTL